MVKGLLSAGRKKAHDGWSQMWAEPGRVGGGALRCSMSRCTVLCGQSRHVRLSMLRDVVGPSFGRITGGYSSDESFRGGKGQLGDFSKGLCGKG